MATKKYVPKSIQNLEDRIAAKNEREIQAAIEEPRPQTFEVIIYDTANPDTKSQISQDVSDASDTNVDNYYYYRARSLAGQHDHFLLPEVATTPEEYEKLRNNLYQGVFKKSGDGELPQTGDVFRATFLGGNLVSLDAKTRTKNITPRFKSQSGSSKNSFESSTDPTNTVSDYKTLNEQLGESDNPFEDNSGTMVNGVYQGSVYPLDPVVSNKKITLKPSITEEYIPLRDTLFGNEPLGLRLLITAQAIKEGYYAKSRKEGYRGVYYDSRSGKVGTKAYRLNNPGNIGNDDAGNTVYYPTLEEGMKQQVEYTKRVANNQHGAYPIGKRKYIEPYYSPEIAENQTAYANRSPKLPGYDFVYTGQLDQYVKIYATAARSSNNYLSMIISYFNMNGITLTNESKIQDIIKMN